MKIYESSEDYLERILMLSKRLSKVRSVDLARDMNFSKPSISNAIKKLKEDDYIFIDKDEGIVLTDKGREIAEAIYDKHVTLTNYFVSLGVSPLTAATDACKIEHDISDETYNAIKNTLNLDKKTHFHC